MRMGEGNDRVTGAETYHRPITVAPSERVSRTGAEGTALNDAEMETMWFAIAACGAAIVAVAVALVAFATTAREYVSRCIFTPIKKGGRSPPLIQIA
jgi:hypothetical protein